jgi:hypothetical protein
VDKPVFCLSTDFPGDIQTLWLVKLPAEVFQLYLAEFRFQWSERLVCMENACEGFYDLLDLRRSENNQLGACHTRPIFSWRVSSCDLEARIWGPKVLLSQVY